MNAYPPGDAALAEFARLRAMTQAVGRDPAAVGIEVWTTVGEGSPADWNKEAHFWKQSGASHLTLTTTFARRHHRRIAGKSLADHVAAMERFRDAVKDAL